MKLKTLTIVVALLFLASVAVFVGNRPAKFAGTDPRVGHALVARDLLAKATKITIEDSGKSVVIAKAPSGIWTVVNDYDLPVDFSKLTQFADQLLKAKIDRFVTANPERIARYDFGHSSVSLADSSGKALWSIDLGKTTSDGGRLVRYKGDSKVFLSRLQLWLDSEAKNWADSTLVSLKSDDIAGLTIEFSRQSSLELVRPKKGAAFEIKSPVGMTEAVDAQKVDALLSSVTTLRFSDTDAPSAPSVIEAEKNSRWVDLRTFEGTDWRLTFSSKPPSRQPAAPTKSGPATKPATPAPALSSPVYLRVACSDAKAPINSLMAKRAFEIYDYTYHALPKAPKDLLVKPPIVAPAAPTPKAPVKP